MWQIASTHDFAARRLHLTSKICGYDPERRHGTGEAGQIGYGSRESYKLKWIINDKASCQLALLAYYGAFSVGDCDFLFSLLLLLVLFWIDCYCCSGCESGVGGVCLWGVCLCKMARFLSESVNNVQARASSDYIEGDAFLKYFRNEWQFCLAFFKM